MDNLRPKPLRQFVDRSQPPERSWTSAKVWIFLYFFGPLLLVPCLYLSGDWLLKHYYSTTPSSTKASLQDDTGVEDFVTRYVSALGGDKAIDQLEQLSFSGIVFTDRNQFTFEGSNSRSEGYAVRLNDTDTVVALDLQGPSRAAQSLPLEESRESTMTALKSIFSDFDNPAVRWLLNKNESSLKVERDSVGQVDLICVTIETGQVTSSKLYFEERRMQLVAREDIYNDKIIATYRYSNHKAVHGVFLPHTVVAQIKGAPLLRLHYATLKASEQPASSHSDKAMVLSDDGDFSKLGL